VSRSRADGIWRYRSQGFEADKCGELQYGNWKFIINYVLLGTSNENTGRLPLTFYNADLFVCRIIVKSESEW